MDQPLQASLTHRAAPAPRPSRPVGDDDPTWYRDAVVYEVQVRSFCDSDGDGVGDLRGLTSKLDYLQDLGVTALWLLPFYPSPLRDDGYDISDYTGVHPQVGTLEDFRRLLEEAHARGLRVITELVLNHTSDQHPWFQRAREAPPGSPQRDLYVWSDDPDRYQGVRIIFSDFEHSNWTWDPVAQAYYWHRFYSHQPDLNFDNPAVREALLEVVDFWFGLGVDGLRLDAVPYLFEREGTSCENLPETHALLKALRAHVDQRFPGRMLLAEANQWPEDAVAYFGDGDECHMAFHFPVMPRLFMAILQEDRYPIVDILEQTPPLPDGCQWAMFLRNHDELTLEMVTDQERDAMVRVYAEDPRARINLGIRRRLAPLLGGHRSKIEIMNALLLSLPGTPVVYYGDEIGMGDNIYLGDRDGVRTPMQWSADRNAGFSRANPQQLHLPVIIDPQYHYEAVNVDLQQASTASLLWWTKRLIALRKQHPAFGRGALRILQPDNRKVLAFLREHAAGERGETLLVVVNLSRHVQCVAIELAEFAGQAPRELLGEARFPPIGDDPYFLTLGGHSFYWFTLEPGPHARPEGPAEEVELSLPHAADGAEPEWPGVAFYEAARRPLDRALERFLDRRRRAGIGGQAPLEVRVRDWFGLTGADACALALVEARFADGASETHVLPLALTWGEAARQRQAERPGEGVTWVSDVHRGRGLIHLAGQEALVARALLRCFAWRRPLQGRTGELVSRVQGSDRAALEAFDVDAAPLRCEERSNWIHSWGDRWVLKLQARIEEGPHPEEELVRHLWATGFEHLAPLDGALRVRGAEGRELQVATLHRAVLHECDLWEYTLDRLGTLLEEAVLGPGAPPPEVLPQRDAPAPAEARERLEPLLGVLAQLGQRLAALHRALAAAPPAFYPEPFTEHTRRGHYQSLRNTVARVLHALEDRLDRAPGEAREAAQRLLARRAELLERLRPVLRSPLAAARIRVHGHLHLGQLLFTGREVLFVDFEGLPHRPLIERRRKQPALADVGGVVASLRRAAWAALGSPQVRAEDRATAEPWLRWWLQWVEGAFLTAYAQGVRGAPFALPAGVDAAPLIDAYALHQGLLELELELLQGRTPTAARLRAVGAVAP